MNSIMKRIRLPEELSLKLEHGMASIGILMVLMTLLLLIVYPLIKTGIEFNALKGLKHDVQMASETAVNDLVSEISTDFLSEGRLVWNQNYSTRYLSILKEKLSDLTVEVEPESILVSLSGSSLKPKIEVQYRFVYKGVVSLMEKKMEVSFVYEIPIDN